MPSEAPETFRGHAGSAAPRTRTRQQTPPLRGVDACLPFARRRAESREEFFGPDGTGDAPVHLAGLMRKRKPAAPFTLRNWRVETMKSRREKKPLDWHLGDIEQRFGFSGGKYTDVNLLFATVLACVLTAGLYIGLCHVPRAVRER